MSVRRARAEDAAAIAELAGELGYPSSADAVLARLRDLSQRDDHCVLVTEVDGGVAGWIHLQVTLRLESPRFAEIGGLVVATDHRGRGLGRGLVEAARAWAREEGCRALRVRTRTARLDARAFYRALGFEQVKTQAVLVLQPSDAGARE